MKRWILVSAALLAACSQPGNAPVQVIVGAGLVDASNHVSVPYSVVVVKDGKIEAAGPQASVPVPRDSAKVNGIGKYVVAAAPGGTIRAGEPADLLLVAANPETDPAFREKVERRMTGGRWVQ